MIVNKNLTSYLFVLCTVFVCCISFAAHTTYAQYQLGEEAAGIEINPTYVVAEKEFTARLTDYSNMLGVGDISWYVNGVVQEDKKNRESITLTAPRVGEPMKIEVSRKGVAQKVVHTVVPHEIDIITEGYTMTPYFYQGRSVSSLGTRARIVAIPHLFTKKGVQVPESQITYTWNVDNVLVDSGGKGVLEIPLSDFGSPLVLLTAKSRDGSVTYAKTFYVEAEEPSLVFYIHNPLTGLSQNAVQDSYYETTEETTIRAQPYALSKDIYEDAQYAWTVNNEPVANASRDPQMITLQKSGSGGISTVGFSILNLATLLQSASDVFRIHFR